MSTNERHTAILALCRAAMLTLTSLPPIERADVYDGIALCCDGLDSDLRDLARAASDAIRDAEMRQMNFAHMLTNSHGKSEQHA